MLITNLTAEPYAYQINDKLIEQCLNAGPSYFNSPDMQEFSRRGDYNQFIKNDSIPFYSDGSISSMNRFHIVTQIPIFLVSKHQSLKKFTISYFGHQDEITVPMEIFPYELPATVEEIINSIASGKYNRNKEVADLYGGNLNSDSTTSSCIDYFGLYIRENPSSGIFKLNESHPRIFIWVDRIYEYVHGDHHKYEITTTLSILHELAHAMMDINLTGSVNKNKGINHDAFFYLKEESLAEAIALTLIKPQISEEDWQFVVSLKKGRPFEYALGLEYLDKSGNFIGKSVGEWLRLKETGEYAQNIAEEWIRYIYGQEVHDITQMGLLDRGMRYPEILCRYPAHTGRFYRTLTSPIKIIKDFVRKNPGITRNELHEAFPDNTNHHFKAIIDLPEQEIFKYKNGTGTRPINPEAIIDCADGQVAVSDYWHPLMMERFIENATRHGISIEMFYTPTSDQKEALLNM